MGAIFAEGRQAARREIRSFGSNVYINIYDARDGGHIVLGGNESKCVAKLLIASDPAVESFLNRGVS